jgi:hypothetical protein
LAKNSGPGVSTPDAERAITSMPKSSRFIVLEIKMSVYC